jgi:hypothetical protein
MHPPLSELLFCSRSGERQGATVRSAASRRRAVRQPAFALITDKAIRRGSFRSAKDLIAKINHFVTHYNQNCKPFMWTATADSILAKLERLCKRITGTPPARRPTL